MENTIAIEKLLSNEELAFFTSQVALMLGSGIPLYEAIEVLSENYTDTIHADAFKKVYQAIEQGTTLADAMSQSGIFPKYAVKMIAIGEQTGKIEQVLRGLAHHYTRENNLHISILNAVRYPLVLLCIMAIVVIILILKVLPLFNKIMISLGASTMQITRTTMKIGWGVGFSALTIVVILLITAAVLTLLSKHGKKELLVNFFSKHISSFARLELAIAAERFLSVLSISLQAGNSTESTANFCIDIIDNSILTGKINKIFLDAEESGSLCDAIAKSDLLDPMKVRMLKIGFMTGKQDEVTANLAELYSKETDSKLEKLLSLVEPTLIAILAIVIGCILMSVMLPLAGLLSTML